MFLSNRDQAHQKAAALAVGIMRRLPLQKGETFEQRWARTPRRPPPGWPGRDAGAIAAGRRSQAADDGDQGAQPASR